MRLFPSVIGDNAAWLSVGMFNPHFPWAYLLISGVHWEWWDFGHDWDYWSDRDYFISGITIRGRLRTPTLGKWQVIHIPIQLSLG
jgi:hypothetical protein